VSAEPFFGITAITPVFDFLRTSTTSRPPSMNPTTRLPAAAPTTAETKLSSVMLLYDAKTKTRQIVVSQRGDI
jgi:hypothetical protein